jgi:hypothetical protein
MITGLVTLRQRSTESAPEPVFKELLTRADLGGEGEQFMVSRQGAQRFGGEGAGLVQGASLAYASIRAFIKP